MKEIFINVNELKNDIINTIVKIISSDILIRKNINTYPNDELCLLQCLVADETGTFNVIFKNENIKFAKLGKEIIIRDAKLEIINGYLILVCDENSILFESNNLINFNSGLNVSLDIFANFSKIKIKTLDRAIV